MGELTKAMLSELRHASSVGPGPTTSIAFNVGEALRRRGLLERYTTHSVGHDYANQSGVFTQTRWQKPKVFHEWWITPAGRAALASVEPDEARDHG